MNYSKYRFNLDMQSYISQISLPVRQHDTGISLSINLTDGGVPYVIRDGCRAVFYARKSDGNPLMNDCIIEKNTTICYELTQQTTACSGIVDCEIRLYGTDGNLITTPRFILVVDSRVVHDDDFPLSDSEQTILDNIILNETERQANEVEREKAEAERESAEAERANVFNEAEAEREEAFDEALETAVRAQDIANMLTKKLEAGEFLGKSVFIRYSDNADGTDYTEVWNGEFYIGIAVAVTAPTDKSGYNWTRFYGDPVSFNELTDVPYSYLDVDEDGYLRLSEDKTVGTPMNFVGQIAANALKGKGSGSAVAMTDISPLEHELSVKVSSKNLISSIGGNGTQNVSIADGVITQIEADTAPLRIFKIQYRSTDGSWYQQEFSVPLNHIGVLSIPFNIEHEVSILRFGLNGSTNDSVVAINALPTGSYIFSCNITNLEQGSISWRDMQIEKGTTATPYAPYLDDVSTVEVKRYGKNLANHISAGGNVVFENGVVTQIEADTYSTAQIKLQAWKGNTFLSSIPVFAIGNIGIHSANITLPAEADRLVFGINGQIIDTYIDIDTTDLPEGVYTVSANFTNITQGSISWRDIQLEVGNASPYEPCIEPTTYAVESDGTVKGVKSLYPSTTLITDNRALIECEYNIDINEAFKKLTQVILSLGGNI